MTPPKKPMSPDHKAALAVGRAEGRAIRAYLEALETNKPKRGRKRTPDSITARLQTIETELESAHALARLELIQEQLDLQAELEAMQNTIDTSQLETEFAAVARSYAERKGISYNAFRTVGVPAAVLKQAGIKQAQS